MKNKIGIMSMQRIINYGSFLQAYGLKKLVENITQENVQFVDYEFGVDLTIRKNKLNKKKNLIKKIKKNRAILNYLKKKAFLRRVKNDLVKNLKTIGVDLINYNKNIDTLIIGSDEVFNCIQPYPVGYSKQLFGEGFEKSAVISYAASFGNTQYDELVKFGIDNEIKKFLLNFKAISVRDKNSANIIEHLLGKAPTVNIDPVLVYDFKEEIIKYQVEKKSDYIIIYAYTDRLSKNEEDYIKIFADKKSKKIISIGNYSRIADENIICNPFYVFSYFKNADYVITDTFHGTIFSIKMNAKFCTIVRESNKNKLNFLLSKLKKLDRKVKTLDDIERLYDIGIEYQETNRIIEIERRNAINYLKDNLKYEHGIKK